MARHITREQYRLFKKYRVHKKYRDDAIEKATEAERLMWTHLQRINKSDLPEGCFFCRQFWIDNFRVDFCCKFAKIVLEVDGSIHEKTKLKDHYKDEYLMRHGWLVVRVRNEDVYDFAHAEAIAKRLVYLCRSRLNMS